MRRIDNFILTAVAVLGAAFVSALYAQPEPTPRPIEPVDPAIRTALEPTDAAISDRVEARLDAELDIFGSRAIVRDGVVTLHGSVRSESDRLRALDIARDVAGVRRVDSSLVVDPTSADDPPPHLTSGAATLDQAVAATLRGDPVLGERDIRVTADPRTNTVTLIGVVKSVGEKERATRIAADAFAGGHVRNELLVRRE